MSVAFGAGLWAGLDSFPSSGEWGGVALVLAAALLVAREAPVGAAIGVMGVAGALWGGAAGGGQGGARAGGGGGGGGGRGLARGGGGGGGRAGRAAGAAP